MIGVRAMPAIYQVYIKNRNGEMTSGRWFMKEIDAVRYAQGFWNEHPDLLLVIVVRRSH